MNLGILISLLIVGDYEYGGVWSINELRILIVIVNINDIVYLRNE